jgi:hypothetical protein
VRVDLAVAASTNNIAWSIAAVGWLVVFFAAFAAATRLFGSGFLAVPAGFGWLYLVSWWRARRMVDAVDELDQRVAAGGLRARVRSGSSMWVVWAGTNTELVVSDGWVLLGDQGWPASSVTLGREPSFWSARPIELLTPSGPVGFSAVPKGDLAMYLSTVVDRRVRPMVERALSQHRGAGPSPAGWYPDPQDPTAWRWWDGVAWGARSD